MGSDEMTTESKSAAWTRDFMTAEERDAYENSILGSGMVWAALAMGQHDKVTVDIVYDGNLATNQMIVKFPNMPGPPGTRGYLLTVTLPEGDASTP